MTAMTEYAAGRETQLLIKLRDDFHDRYLGALGRASSAALQTNHDRAAGEADAWREAADAIRRELARYV